VKKFYAILLLIFLSHTVFAQPVFTQTNFYSIGDAIATYDLDTTGLSPGNYGANQTWDFSSAVSTGSVSTAYVVTPAATPYSSLYPTANLALQTYATSGIDAYSFYDVDPNRADVVGVGTHSSTVDNFFNYSDPLRVINFPFTYNSTGQDNYVGFSTYIVSGYTMNDYKRGTYSILADGYGSVTTPEIYYPYCLRTVTVENVVDSVVITGFPTPSMITSNRTTYSYISANEFTSVFLIAYDTTDQGGGPVANKFANFSSFVTGISETPNLKVLNVYPNPAIKSTRVNLNANELKSGQTTFYAIDSNGRIAKQIDFMLNEANHKSLSIDMSDCSEGLYFIRLVQKDVTYSSKFVLN